MTSKSTFFISVTLLATLAVGIAIGVAMARQQPDPADVVNRWEHEDLAARHQETLGRLEEALNANLAQKKRAVATRADLVAQVESIERKLGDQLDLAATEAEAGAKTSNAPLSFGKWAELDAVKNADWNELAGAVEKMNALFLAMVEQIENDEPVDVDLQDKIREQNNKLVRYAAQIIGKIPTHSPINGEFTHPITLANLAATMLERAGRPVTDEQKSEIARLGAEFDSIYDELQSGYSDETPRLRKLIDELELKRDTMNILRDVLDESQRDLIVHPDIHDRLGLDILSPASMAAMLAGSGKATSVDEMRDRFSRQVSKKFRLDESQVESLDAIADSWIDDIRPLLTPVKKVDRFLRLDRAIAAGRAQVAAFEKILGLPGLDDRARQAILSEISWGVPSIVEAPSESERRG